MPEITIDGNKYNSDDLSDNGKANLISLQFTQSEVKRLQALLAIAKTAELAYATSLKKELEGN